MSRRRIAFAAVAAVLVLLFGGRWFALRYTEHAWFADLGEGGRYLRLLARGLLWRAVAFGVAFAWYGASLLAVYRSIGSVQLPQRLANLEIAEAVPPRLLRAVALVTAAALALATAYTFGDLDRYVALYRHAVPYGLADPVLGRDVGFYLARLPLLELAHVYCALAAVFGFALVLSLYALTGNLTVRERRLRITRHARTHIAALLAVAALVLAWGFYLDALQLVGGGGRAGGVLTAVDRGVRIPAAHALALLSLFVAGGTILTMRWSRPVVLVGLWVTLAAATLLGRWVVPALAEARGSGDAALETALRHRGDDFTRAAFGLETLERRDLGTVASAPAAPGRLAEEIAGIVPWSAASALLDSALRLATGDTASITSWTRNVVIGRAPAARGRPLLLAAAHPDALRMARRLPGTAWTISHRGSLAWGGPVAAIDAGLRAGPLRWMGSLEGADTVAPGTPLRDVSERIRFLPSAAGLAVVGPGEALPGQPPPGLLLRGPLRRLLLAWALQSPPLLTDRTSSADRVLYWRDVPARLARLYPFAVFDPPRPVLTGGRLTWAADGYLTSSRFPLSRRIPWGGEDINFLSPAYLATVDAFRGTTRLYLRPGAGPFARSVALSEAVRVLPDDSLDAGLAARLGYPEGLFGAQAFAVAALGEGPDSDRWLPAAGDSSAVGRDAALLWPTTAVLRLGEADPRVWSLTPLTDGSGRSLAGILAGASGARGALRLVLYRAGEQPLPSPSGGGLLLSAAPGMASAVAAFGTATPALRGPVHVIPALGSAAYVQVLFSAEAGGNHPVARAVAVLFEGRTGVGDDAHTAAGSLEQGDGGAALAGLSLAALADARAAFVALDSARARGDWAAFGRAWEALRRALLYGGVP